jgi:hypothetical protein
MPFLPINIIATSKEDVINKSQDVATDQASNSKYPSVKALFDWAVGLFVPQTRTINSKALTSNVTLTPSDIGAPSGSGTSTGTNTGDETQSSILSKLNRQKLTKTGDQTTTSLDAVAVTGLESTTLTAGKYAITGSIAVGSSTTAGMKLGVILPDAATMRVKGLDRGSTPLNSVTVIFTSTNNLSSLSFCQVNGDSVVNIDGTITIGATDGIVSFIFAKTTSGTASILDEGTQIIIEKL